VVSATNSWRIEGREEYLPSLGAMAGGPAFAWSFGKASEKEDD
jgi:hypothetical protein